MTTKTLTAREYLSEQRWFNTQGVYVYYRSETGTSYKILGASGDYSEPKIHLIAGDNYGRDIITVDLDSDRHCIYVEDGVVSHKPRVDWEVEVKTLKDGFKQELYRAELFMPGENIPTVRVYMDRKPYGAPQHEITVSVNWSACGNQSVEATRWFIKLVMEANEIADMLKTRYEHLRRQFEWDKTFEAAPSTDEK